jgi:hypothetical protein
MRIMHTDHLFVHTDDAVSVVTDIIPRVFPEILEVMRVRKISEQEPDVVERFEQQREEALQFHIWGLSPTAAGR